MNSLQFGWKGNTYALSVSYTFRPARSLSLKPELSFIHGNLAGASNANDGYSTSLILIYVKRRYIIMARLFYGVRNCEEAPPLFDNKRGDDSSGAVLMATYFRPFDLKGYFVQGFLGYAKAEWFLAAPQYEIQRNKKCILEFEAMSRPLARPT